MLRLNLAVPPSAKPNDGGLVAGDAAGFPNGRRISDDVVTIELRAIAGATIPLVDPSYTPDGAASAIQDGTTNTNAALLKVVPVPRASRWWVPDGARHHEGVMSTPAEVENPFAGQGSVLLDIGDESARSWSRCPTRWRGSRSRSGRTTTTTRGTPTDHVHHPHVAVVNRPVAGGQLPSLVLPGGAGGQPTGSTSRRATSGG